MTNMFSPFLMAILTSNLLIALTVLILRNKTLLVSVGYPVLIIIIALVTIRLLFPFEMPFANTVQLPETLSILIGNIRHPFGDIKGFQISIWNLFTCIWLIGSAICLGRYFYVYFDMIKKINAYNISPECVLYHSLLDKICTERGKQNNFHVIVSENIHFPCLFGILRPYIFMPKDADKILDWHDLYLILCHEFCHHFYHDLLIKFIINILTSIYWWNPVCWVLKHQADVVLDMRVDKKITLNDKTTKAAYLSCLLKLLSNDILSNNIDTNYTVSICRNAELLSKRFIALTENRKRSIIVSCFSVMITLLSFCLSYTFVFEAFYYTAEAQYYIDAIEKFDMYAVLNDKGTYDIYFNGNYLETVDSLDFFPVDEIYNIKGELLNDN